MNLLIGYDGSDSPGDAILELYRAGLPADTNERTVPIGDVWPRTPLEPAADAAAASRSREELVTFRFAGPLLAALPDAGRCPISRARRVVLQVGATRFELATSRPPA